MLPEPRALALCRQICGALAAAHAKGIVHRDLKPENIFIVRDSDIAGGERTKILDFGIAKLTNRMSVTGLTGMTGMTGDLTSITTIGAMIGTPAYMAPEQSEGASDVDQRADLYSLGCILFELICGRCPFTVEGAGLITAHHLFTPPPAPSSFAPVTPRLEQVILRLLAKEPEQRFGSADELLAVLQEIAEPSTRDSSAAVRIPRPPAAVRVPRVWRLPVYLALAIAVVAVFAAGRQSAGDDRPVAVQVPVSTPAPGSGDAAPQIPPAPRSPAVIPLVAAVTPAQAILHIASTPGGAEVYRMPDNVRVGVTPLRYPVGAAPEPLVLVLRKPGYREASVALTADHDLDRMVALIRKPSEGRTRPRASRPPAADEFMTRTPAPGGSSKSLRDELTERRQ
jgi:serine/threonine-protein kinase